MIVNSGSLPLPTSGEGEFRANSHNNQASSAPTSDLAKGPAAPAYASHAWHHTWNQTSVAAVWPNPPLR